MCRCKWCPWSAFVAAGLIVAGISARYMAADEEVKKISDIKLAKGRIQLKVPETWETRKPQTRIVEYEFAALREKGDETPARITVTGAGGGVQANIDRWIDQFEQPDGSASKDKAEVEKKEVSGGEVHFVSIAGTYKDRPGGPLSQTPAVMREDYRMLAAIVVTPKLGHYYIKMVGPKETVDANEEAFRKMMETLQVRETAE